MAKRRIETQDEVIKRLRKLAENNPGLFEQVAREQREASETEFKEGLSIGMMDENDNVYRDAPGFVFLKPEYRFFIYNLPFKMPGLPPKPIKSESTVDMVSAAIVGIVETDCTPIENSKTKQIAAGQFVRIRAKASGGGYDFVFATSKEIANHCAITLIGSWDWRMVEDLAKTMYDKFSADKTERENDEKVWLEHLRNWEWEMFLLAQKHAASMIWSPLVEKDKMFAATTKDEALEKTPIYSHPEAFYVKKWRSVMSRPPVPPYAQPIICERASS